MNSRPNLSPLVSSYEEVIRKNRECGFNKDLLGQKSTMPSPFSPEQIRRRSENYSSQVSMRIRQAECPKLLQCPPVRRMTLLDAMSASTFRARHHGQISLSQPPKPLANAFVRPKSSFKKSTTTTNKIVTAPKKFTRKVSVAVEEEDEEQKALRQKVENLKSQVQKIEQDEQDQLWFIEQAKKVQMKKFQEKRQANLGIMATIALHKKQMDDKAKKQQKIIECLSRSNKKLRQEGTDLAASIKALKEANIVLENEQSITQVYYNQLSEFHNSDQDVHSKAVNILPKYRNKVEELDSEAADEAAWIEMEQRTKKSYEACTDAILSMVETRCRDTDLVDRVVSLSLGLAMDMK